MADDRGSTPVGHGEDDDVAGRGTPERSRCGAAAELFGQGGRSGGVTADDFDSVATVERACTEDAGHVSHADDADGAHDVPTFYESG
jgi:hypothetical protein